MVGIEIQDGTIAEIVAEGLLGLLADPSRTLLKSVDDAATRAWVVDRLTEVLAELNQQRRTLPPPGRRK